MWYNAKDGELLTEGGERYGRDKGWVTMFESRVWKVLSAPENGTTENYLVGKVKFTVKPNF